MGQIPRPLLVILVLIIGIIVLFLAKSPHSVCDSQKDVFIESQKGTLFPTEFKGQKIMPVYGRYLESCRSGNSPGACYEFFGLLRKVLRDLQASSEECMSAMGEVNILKKIFSDALELMSLLAWGNKPPDQGVEKNGWLEASDLALYCGLKKNFLQMYGMEDYEKLRIKIQSKFPGEQIVVKDGVCLNCESRKNAIEVLSTEEIWVRSLFSTRCDQY